LVRIQDAGLSGQSDETVLAWAAQQGRVLDWVSAMPDAMAFTSE